MGNETEKIYNSFSFKKNNGKKNVESVIAKFDAYFTLKRNNLRACKIPPENTKHERN